MRQLSQGIFECSGFTTRSPGRFQAKFRHLMFRVAAFTHTNIIRNILNIQYSNFGLISSDLTTFIYGCTSDSRQAVNQVAPIPRCTWQQLLIDRMNMTTQVPKKESL